MQEENKLYPCVVCGDDVGYERWKLGYNLCKPCGEAAARNRKHTIAPINKSNYMLITDLSQLKQLNPKRTT